MSIPHGAVPGKDKEPGRTLRDLGEFRLLNELVLPTVGSVLGDDCAVLDIPAGVRQFVVTTDAAPRPLIFSLGVEDFWAWGWYSVLINASDAAAVGASPLAFTSSVEAPDTFQVDALREFFDGMTSACHYFNLTNAGGNLRQAPRFACHGTAIGTLPPGESALNRRECAPGDAVFVIGHCGLFISAFLNARSCGILTLAPGDKDRLAKPVAQNREMSTLRRRHLVTSASDNSDGLLGAMWNIAERSGCGFELNLDELRIPEIVSSTATANDFDPLNLLFCWGDWNVVITVAPSSIEEFLVTTRAEGISAMRLGHAIAGPAHLAAVTRGKRYELALLRNENFTRSSYNADVSDQLKFMLQTPLLKRQLPPDSLPSTCADEMPPE